MAKQNKTQPTKASVKDFIDSVPDETKRADAHTLMKLFRKITRKKPVMWGDSLIGFGKYQYKYASGHGGEFFLTGFSPRKQNLTVYIMTGFEKYGDLMAKLGKYKTGRSCLYINKLEDVDIKVLEKLIKQSTAAMEKSHC